jgi:copper chaperone CopZ
MAGVQVIEVGVENKDVTVQYDTTQTSESTLRERLDRAGFTPQ